MSGEFVELFLKAHPEVLYMYTKKRVPGEQARKKRSSKTAQFKAEEESIDFLKAHEESDQVYNKFYLALSRRWMATPPLSENSKHFNEEAEEDEEGKSSYDVFVRRVLKRTEWENTQLCEQRLWLQSLHNPRQSPIMFCNNPSMTSLRGKALTSVPTSPDRIFECPAMTSRTSDDVTWNRSYDVFKQPIDYAKRNATHRIRSNDQSPIGLLIFCNLFQVKTVSPSV
ncbi:hypothetical protein RUM43_001670 [Polyplax serrata]|uniref:Uncharacterized protein n=1 Tax=Polyplax serrata TaxID=468196 RepID=A0AAN8SE92_POLSC